MPRAPPKCGHCEVVGHTRASCRDLEVDKILQMCGGEVHAAPEKIKTHKIPFEKLAELQLLIEGHIPAVIFKTKKQVNVACKYEIVIVKIVEDQRFKKETILFSEEKWTKINNTWKDYTKSINDNSILLTEKCQTYLQKLSWLQRDLPGMICGYDAQLRHQREFTTTSLHNLFHVDYIAEKENLLRSQTRFNDSARANIDRARANIEAHNQQRQAENVAREQVVQVQHIWMNREPLPILRETAIETDDCPICLDTLGDTAKVILRCGHQLCTTCMLTQTLRAATATNMRECQCPICRSGYL
tara:strand:+ start:305 stop:1207 length:903 start_codon:yes stop_codon:yes gene_type:complete